MRSIDHLDRKRVIVEDLGTGMDFETVTTVWLEPGTDFRLAQRKYSLTYRHGLSFKHPDHNCLAHRSMIRG